MQSLSNRLYLYLSIALSLSLLLRLLYGFLFEAEIPAGADQEFFIRTAHGIINGEGYRVGNLLAYQPPLYTYFIAGVFAVLGESLRAVSIIQAFMGTLMCLFVFLIGRLYITARAGLIAAAVCAIYPALIHLSGQLWSEQLFMFFLVSAIFCFLNSERKLSVPWGIASGILLGLASLTREAGLFAALGFLIYLILMHKDIVVSLKRWWIIALFMVLTMSPWTIRNYFVFKEFVPISTNGGINFYMGNNPEANGTFKWALPPGTTWNKESPNGFYEIQANRLGYKYGLRFIKENPGRFMVLTAKRAFYLWQPPYNVIDFSESKVETLMKLFWLAMHIVLFIFSFVIALFFLRSDFRVLFFFLIIILMLMVPSLLSVGAIRYHFPMLPLMALISAFILEKMFTFDWKVSRIRE